MQFLQATRKSLSANSLFSHVVGWSPFWSGFFRRLMNILAASMWKIRTADNSFLAFICSQKYLQAQQIFSHKTRFDTLWYDRGLLSNELWMECFKNNRITYGFAVQTCLHICLTVYPFWKKRLNQNQRYQDMQLKFNIFGIVLQTQTPFNILFVFLVVFSEA